MAMRQMALAKKCFKVYQTGFDKSPKISHSCSTVFAPTSRITKRPTNLTENAQPNMAPVRDSQIHHWAVKGWSWYVLNLTIPYVDPDMKKRRIGSSSMYWFSVSMPTSEKMQENPFTVGIWRKPKVIFRYLTKFW